MNPTTLRLVLLLSCCHALVHVYELSFASVEQLVAAEFQVGKQVTGMLGSCLRLPFGLCALGTGWLADWFGAKRLLLVYLVGCSGAALLAWFSPVLAVLFAAMFGLGLFASIYHPAGVGLISHETAPETRPMALGYHGIFGSAGVAVGPLLAGLALNAGISWREYYLVLSLPGLLLAGLLSLRLAHRQPETHAVGQPRPADDGEDRACWYSYFTLVTMASLAGIVYAAILTFLPRYLSQTGLDMPGIPEEALRNYLASGVLLLGILGQYAAGRIARPGTLEPWMAFSLLASAPLSLWMGLAVGTSRLWATALFAPLFFMHQPLFNSAVAKYVPRRRRSLCYGLSFTVGFGVGSIGPAFAGYAGSEAVCYGTLAALLCLAAVLALVLWHWNRAPARGKDSPPGGPL